jgi:prophage regulatory protein
MKRILRLPAVVDRTGLARSTIYLRMRNQNFPEAVNLGGRAVGWFESEINDWLELRAQSSRGSTEQREHEELGGNL